jgi:hypothetical protein
MTKAKVVTEFGNGAVMLDPITGRMLEKSCWNGIHQEDDPDEDDNAITSCGPLCKCMCHDVAEDKDDDVAKG